MSGTTTRESARAALRERSLRLRTGVAAALVGLALVAIFVWLLLPSVPNGVIASGGDMGSYLITTRFMVDSLRTQGYVPAINPQWYAGFSVFHNTPLTVYALFVPAYALTGDLIVTSHVCQVLLALLAGIVAFLALRKRFSPAAALVGGFMYATVPVVLDQTIWAGSYPRTLALTFGVACFPFVDDVVDNGPRSRSVATLAALTSAGIVTHAPTGAAFALMWTAYAIVRALLTRAPVMRTAGAWAIGMALAGGLAAWYLVPFFVEAQGWTTFPSQVYSAYSVKPGAALPWLGWGQLGLLALAVLLRRKDRSQTAFALTGALAVLLAAGSHIGLDVWMPALSTIYPHIFLFFAAFATAYASAAVSDHALDPERPYRAPLAALVLFAMVLAGAQARTASAEAGAFASATYVRPDDTRTADYVGRTSGDARVMIMKYPNGDLPYWVNARSDKPGIEGWYYSLTPIGKHIAWAYEAVDHLYPAYTADLLDRWNVRTLVANKNFQDGGPAYAGFTRVLQARGFTRSFASGSDAVYRSRKASRYVAPLTARTLVVGRYASHPASVLGDAVIAGSAYVDDLTPELLSHFDTLVLSGFSFRSRPTAERLVTDFAARGGSVVVDLLGMQYSPIEEQAFFLKVTAVQHVTRKAVHPVAVSAIDGVPSLPKTIALPRKPRAKIYPTLTEWRYPTYLGLDRSLADDREQPGQSLVGYRAVPGGRVWFLGGNLFYHAFLKHDEREIALIRSLAGGGSTESTPPVRGTAATVRERKNDPDLAEFTVSAPDETAVLVSRAYYQHWRATVDGKPLRTYNVDDLILLLVPAGRHVVRVEYADLPVHWFANAVTLLSLIVLGWIWVRGLLRPRPQPEPQDTDAVTSGFAMQAAPGDDDWSDADEAWAEEDE